MKSYYLLFLPLVMLFAGCSKENSASADGGQGGSLARFAIRGNNLYTVNSTSLKLFSLTAPANPVMIKDIPIQNTNAVIETIFIRDDTTMFIGSQDGMYIYSIKNPDAPTQLSLYTHIRSCDPVVADANYAFVTLSTETVCNTGLNQLEVIDLSTIYAPTLLKAYSMNKPKGLGIAGNLLFVCDQGLKVFDRSDLTNLQRIEMFSIPAIDVIPTGNRLIVLAQDGLYQYSYTTGNLTLLSHLTISP